MAGFHFLGMDEAGYGPNLGPLLIAATTWTIPESPTTYDLYAALEGIVFRDKVSPDIGIQIADSKVVYSSSGGLRNLETSALTLLQLAGLPVNSFHDLLRAVDPLRAAGSLKLPWYENSALSLPLEANREDIRQCVTRLQQRCHVGGLSLSGLQVAFIEPVTFNKLLEILPNKAELLSRTAFDLLRTQWSPSTKLPTLVIGDKHGGRNRYDQLLADYLDGEMIFRLEEQQLVSRYRVGATELRFQQGGERHLPVAAASIIAKYLRELAMMLHNQYWSSHLPDLKPTKGYPEDAQRYRQAILDTAQSLGFEESLWWRRR